MRDAADSGCDVAVVTTLPGSKSQENVQKLGVEDRFGVSWQLTLPLE